MTPTARARLQCMGAMAASAGFGLSFFCLHHLGAVQVSSLAYAECFILIAALLAGAVLLLAWKERHRARRDEREEALWEAIKAVVRPAEEDEA